MKATKKPVTIECVKWDGENLEEVQNFCGNSYIGGGKDDDKKVYIKSEADEVIAEKDAEIAQLQAMLEERNKQVAELDAIAKRNQRAAQTLRKKMNHHKYKRCLAMADFCESQQDYCYAVGNGFWLVRGDTEARDKYRKKADGFWMKWHIRWLELAEKFKEAK